MNDANLFLNALKEEGIDHIYCPPPKNLKSSSSSKSSIEDLRSKILNCSNCDELSRTRNKVVFGAGSLDADLVFVGEAPGRDEDMQGLPFVGRSGMLLTKIIQAMELRREDVFICNVLKCRPPGNRAPKPEEISKCQSYLIAQLELIKPKVICALGTFAAQTLLKTDVPISRLRGHFHSYQNIPLMCTYHPAYLLRSPGEKKKVWEDVQQIMRLLNES